jgi:hypothetical protein
MENFGIATIWHWQHWLDGLLIRNWTDKNLCVLEGRNHVLNSEFVAGTQIATWYVAIFEDDHTPASGDNYATPGYTECTAYEGATRPGWQPGTVSAAVVDNSANRASFTFNDTKEIFGGALVGGGTTPETKGDVAGGSTLFCESKFAASENVINESVLKLLVEITLNSV